MKYKKITDGYVVQEYGDDDKPIRQYFIAGAEVAYENAIGDPIEPRNEEYLPFDMVQPEDMIPEKE